MIVLLARQAVLLGPPGLVRETIAARLEKLGVRVTSERVGPRAESLLRTARRLAIVLVDAREEAASPKLIAAAREEKNGARIIWLASGGDSPEADGVRPDIVLRGSVPTSVDNVAKVIEQSLLDVIFPKQLLQIVTDATRHTFAEQYGMSLSFKTTTLRGDAEPLGEAAVGVSITSGALVAYLSLFASRRFLEEHHRAVHGVASLGQEIAMELANVVAGRLRTLLLKNIADLRCRIPAAWDNLSSARQTAPAAVIQFERSGERVFVDLRVAQLDNMTFERSAETTILESGSVSFLE